MEIRVGVYRVVRDGQRSDKGSVGNGSEVVGIRIRIVISSREGSGKGSV